MAIAVTGLLLFLNAQATHAQKPSFDCSRVEAGSMERLVCDDAALAALDRKMADVFAAALAKAHNEHPPTLRAEQRGWIKGRNDCWKSDDRRACVETAYRLRIAELEARYRLIAPRASATYICQSNPSNAFDVSFFETDPQSAIVERGDRSSFMTLQPGGSGSRYTGRNETMWIKGDEAVFTWGVGASELRCVVGAGARGGGSRNESLP